MNAAFNSHPLIVQSLVDQGADVNIISDNRLNALLLAAYGYRSYITNIRENSYEIIRTLLSKNVDVTMKDEYGRDALMLVAASTEWSETLLCNLVLEMIEKGADLAATDEFGCSALTYLIRSGRFKTANELIYCGADISIKDNKGNTLLMYVANRPLDYRDEFDLNYELLVTQIIKNVDITAINTAAMIAKQKNNFRLLSVIMHSNIRHLNTI